MKSTLLLATALGLGGFLTARTLRPGPPVSPVAPALAPTDQAAPAVATASSDQNADDLPRPASDEIMAAEPEAGLLLLIRWLPGATAEELASLARSLEEADSWHPGAWEALVRRWVEVAPDAALRFARERSEKMLLRMTGNYTMQVPSVEAYRALLQLDLELGLSLLAAEPGPLLTQLLRQLVTSVEKPRREAWAAGHADIPEASAWAAKPDAATAGRPHFDLHGLSEEDKAITALLKAKDLAGGRAKIDAMPQNYHRALLELEYATALAQQKSPAEAAGWAISHLQGLARLQAIALAAQELSKTDPRKALAMLRDNKVPEFGKNVLGVVEVSTEGSSSISYRGANRTMVKDVLTAAAAVDPAGAMDYLRSAGGILPRDLRYRYVDNEDADNNGSLGRSLYKDWAARDPRAAATWLAAQSLTAGVAEMLPLVAGPLAAQGGPDGRGFITALPDGPVRQEMLAHAAAQWGQEDGPAALQWAATNGGGAGLSRAFDLLAEKNAEIASQQFAGLPPEVQSTQLQSLTNALGNQKPQALPAFYGQLAPEQQGTVNLRDAIGEYAKLNVEQASGWLDEVPESPARDSGISGLVDYLIQNKQPDPEAAAHWAAASLTPEAQARRLERVANAWQKQDPTGAAAAIRNSQLDAAVQQQLLQFLNPSAK